MGIGEVSVSGDRWEEVCLWWLGERRAGRVSVGMRGEGCAIKGEEGILAL